MVSDPADSSGAEEPATQSTAAPGGAANKKINWQRMGDRVFLWAVWVLVFAALPYIGTLIFVSGEAVSVAERLAGQGQMMLSSIGILGGAGRELATRTMRREPEQLSRMIGALFPLVIIMIVVCAALYGWLQAQVPATSTTELAQAALPPADGFHRNVILSICVAGAAVVTALFVVIATTPRRSATWTT